VFFTSGRSLSSEYERPFTGLFFDVSFCPPELCSADAAAAGLEVGVVGFEVGVVGFDPSGVAVGVLFCEVFPPGPPAPAPALLAWRASKSDGCEIFSGAGFDTDAVPLEAPSLRATADSALELLVPDPDPGSRSTNISALSRARLSNSSFLFFPFRLLFFEPAAVLSFFEVPAEVRVTPISSSKV
jgi:hypothetical protein